MRKVFSLTQGIVRRLRKLRGGQNDVVYANLGSVRRFGSRNNLLEEQQQGRTERSSLSSQQQIGHSLWTRRRQRIGRSLRSRLRRWQRAWQSPKYQSARRIGLAVIVGVFALGAMKVAFADEPNTYQQLVTFSSSSQGPGGGGSTQSTSASYSLTVNVGDFWKLIAELDGATWTASSSDVTVAGVTVSGNNILIEALAEGEAVITATAVVSSSSSSSTTYTITATLTVDNNFDLKSTFTSYRYYHLDPKVDVDFTIYLYDATIDSMQAITPADVSITQISAKIYNTSADSESPTYNASAGTWSQTTSMSNYNASDTYNGMTVASYEVNFNSSPTYDENDGTYEYQSVGGHQGATSSTAALCYYDGDTVVLTVTIQYTYNGATYTQDVAVTYTVSAYYNLCSSKDNTGDMRGFDIQAYAQDITEIAATRIQKVDQYGNPVTGAVFALYITSQDENYYYLIDGEGETAIYADLSNATYETDAKTGVISNIEGAAYYTYDDDGEASEYSGSVTNATITPRLVGSTDSDGYFTFVYPEDYETAELVGVAMTMSDLKRIYGEFFVLSETDAPTGYRALTSELKIHVTGAGTTLTLTCENKYESGVSTIPVALVMATGTLYDTSGNSYTYWTKDDETGQISTSGTLFAVVLKKGNNGNDATIDSWYPLYGNKENAYTILDTAGVESAITAAKGQVEIDGSTEGVIFAVSQSSEMVSAMLTNLPGEISDYYTYIEQINAQDDNEANDSVEAIRAEAEYFVAYYYTDADSLDSATTENTRRVVSRGGTLTNYSGFTIQWGSRIEVTDYENRVFFQKIAAGGELGDNSAYINGAVFALYSTGYDTSDAMYYVADDGTAVYLEADTDGDNQGTATVNSASGTYSISATSGYSTDGSGNVTDSGYGVITVTVSGTTYTITPVQVGDTHSDCGTIGVTSFSGTGHFTGVDSGTYVVREIYAPKPYALNTNVSEVVITDDGVYANAGTADDGVTVGKGPGYISPSMDKEASEGYINRTLSYIYGTLQTNGSASGSDIASGNVEWSDTETQGAWEYSNGDSAVFNYAVNSESSYAGNGSQRLYTNTGWSRLAIYQDYEYGSKKSEEDGVDTYNDLTSYGDISYLFSRSTFIVVEDEFELNLDISKIDASTTQALEGAEFYLYYEVTGDDGSTTRYYYANSGSDSSSTTWVEATVGSDGTYTVPDTATKLSPGTEAAHVYGLSSTVGTYYLEEVTAPEGYDLLSAPITITVAGAEITATYNGTTYSTSSESDGSGWSVTKNEAGDNETDSYTFTLTVPNSTYTQLTVTKEWSDSDNQDGIRPESITVTVYADGETTDNTATITPDNDGNWTYTFENLPIYNSSGQAITYSVVETAIDGYETTYGDVSGSASEGYTVTVTNSHTPETISLSGTKTWDDADNQDGKRPSEITVNLYADGELVESKTVTASDNWAYSFENLPKYKDGQEITYTITETAVEDYTATYDGYDITNSYTPSKTSVTVTKAWDDADNQDGVRPDTITVTLYANGETTDQTVELSSSNEWTATFSDLDEYQNGEKIEYTIKELTVDGYEVVITGDASEGYTLTNSHTPETISLSGTKTWDDADNQDGKRPSEITVNLYADGELVESKTVTASDNWAYSFENLPKYKDGQEITYTITETAVEGYTTEITGSVEEGYTITNSLITGALTLVKSSANSDLTAGNANYSLEGAVYTLYTDEACTTPALDPTGNPITLITDETGTASLSSLSYGTYYLKETSASEGYNLDTNVYPVEIKKTGANVAITSAEPAQTMSVAVTKFWDDYANAYSTRPDTITITLSGTQNNYRETVTLTAANAGTDADTWTYTFENLPLDSYIVTEELVPGYATAITGDQSEGYTITNTQITGALTLVKASADPALTANNSNYSLEGAVYALYTDETCTIPAIDAGGQEITLTTDATGMATVDSLPLGTYYLKEITPSEGYDLDTEVYTAVIAEAENSTETEGNTESNPDANAGKNEATPVGSETFTIDAEGGDSGEDVTTDDGEAGSSNDADPDDNGDNTNDGTNADGSTNNGTDQDTADPASTPGVVIYSYEPPRTMELTITKLWDDADDKDGLRPDSITVTISGVTNPYYTLTAELTASAGWLYTFANLPLDDYELAEIAVAGYTTAIIPVYATNDGTVNDNTASGSGNTTDTDGNSANPALIGFTITNSHTPAPEAPDTGRLSSLFGDSATTGGVLLSILAGIATMSFAGGVVIRRWRRR